MNKAILTSFTILCMLSIPLLMDYGMFVKAEVITLYVDDDNVTGPWDGTKEYPYQNITNALEHAIDGKTIFVRTGIYYGPIVVNKSVSLVGEERDLTIVDGNVTGNVISITADNVSIVGFTIQRSGARDHGIFFELYSGIHISHNTITNNYRGISLYSSSGNVFSGNTISSNNYGIVLYLSSGNVFSGNTISSNKYSGISLYSSSGNVFSGNTISSNNYGVFFRQYSMNNTFYHNNFNNTYQVLNGSPNGWDDGDEGNYWSDYTGVDLNYDGIGDTPYVIDTNNQDNLPLMGMFSDFSVTLERETYCVTTICNSTISDFRFEIGSETGSKIIRFDVTGRDNTVGFCRVMIPTELMSYPHIILVDVEEIIPTLLDVSNETRVSLYFTYIHSRHTITIVYSKALALYNELCDKHVKLQTDLYNLNATYQKYLYNYSILSGNYSQLQERYYELNNSYQEHLLDYSTNVHNIRNLMYIFATTTAIFIIITIYLSKQAHESKTKRPHNYSDISHACNQHSNMVRRIQTNIP